MRFPFARFVILHFGLVSIAVLPSVAATFTRPACIGGQVVSNTECCQWFGVMHDLQANVFNGRCGQEARAAIRLTFHDGIGFSKSLWDSGKFGGGGADGSIIQYSSIELGYAANRGLEGIVRSLHDIATVHNVSYGDIIQFAGALSLTYCPGSPRLQFLSGRLRATAPAPPDLTPSPSSPIDTILGRMADAGFTADDTVALLAAHSVATQETTDPESAGLPLDSTPGVFDTQYYLETLLKGRFLPGNGRSSSEAKSNSRKQFRLKSDDVIARSPQTACRWQFLMNNPTAMMAAFRESMIKVATNGQDIEGLVDCSDVIPVPLPWGRPATLPRGMAPADVENHCNILQTSETTWYNTTDYNA